MNNLDVRFYWQSLNDTNFSDLLGELHALTQNRSNLVAICDEEADGIIGYALSEDHARTITHALTLQAGLNIPSYIEQRNKN